MIPVLHDPPLCYLRELKDGTYDLADVSLMIDGIMMEADNRAIVEEIRARAARRG